MSAIDLPVDGPSAPPRSNGELVFEAPWESRVFGITAALVEGGHLSWPDMQQALIAAVAESGDRPYWESWLVAATRLTDEAGLVGSDALRVLSEQLAAREPGHDH